jgi:metal-sulfur cluster biosynthetic enzyme
VSESSAVTPGTVLQALGGVMDPELDRSIVELDFVGNVVVLGGDVRVELRLPTFWCAPALAWMMADDARLALQGVPGVTGVRVIVAGHHAETEITDSVNSRRGFDEAFAGEVDGDLGGLRDLFRRKTYLARLARLVATLPSVPAEDSALCDLPDTEEARAYLAARSALGLDCSPAAPLMMDPSGALVRDARQFLRAAQTVRVSLDANAGLCRALLDARLGRNPGRE